MAAARQDDNAPYQVVARRFRPRSFDEVVGQEHILQSLQRALQQQRIPHAFLFSGSRGVGKTTMARILARCLNCEQGPTPAPCGQCELCRSILDGSNTDVVEIDAATYTSVDDIRAMREAVGFAAMRSRYRVYILDEVHMLSKGAFNAFLKTLEEPPPNVVFVLATTELHKVPETVRSRCQLLLFRRLADRDIVERLRMIADKEGVRLADAVLEDIAASSRGGMRDSETLLERVLPLARELGAAFDLAAYRQVVQRLGADRTVEVAAALLAGDARQALHFARELQQAGVDEREALGELVEQLRWLLLLRVDGPDSELVPQTGEVRRRLQELAASADPARLDAMIQAGLLGRDRIKRFEDRGVLLELSLLRMAQAGSLPTLADLLATVTSGQLPQAQLPAQPQPSQPQPAQPQQTQPQQTQPQQTQPQQTQPQPNRAHFGQGPRTTPQPSSRQPASAGQPPSPSQPAAPPAAARPPAAAGELRARLLQRLQVERPLLLGTIELCQIDGPDAAGTVRVQMQTDSRMHRDRLASPDLQKQLKAMLLDLAPGTAEVKFEIGGAAGPDRPVTADTKGGDRTQRVLGRFGGRIVAVDPDDRPGASPASAPEPPPADDAPWPEDPDR